MCQRLTPRQRLNERTLIQRGLVLGVALDVLGEPFGELLVRVEERGHDEVQQRPQLRARVLRSHERQSLRARQHAMQCIATGGRERERE